MEGRPSGHAGLRRRRRLPSGVRGRWMTTWKGLAPPRTPSPRAGPREVEAQMARPCCWKGKERRARPFSIKRKPAEKTKKKRRLKYIKYILKLLDTCQNIQNWFGQF